jgi:shikimate dehydrogenase
MGVPYAEVIGDPIAHSKSPLIHNFWLQKLGIEAEYRRTHVAAEGLSAFLAARRLDRDWRGCNVTIPHKEGSCRYSTSAHLFDLAARQLRRGR